MDRIEALLNRLDVNHEIIVNYLSYAVGYELDNSIIYKSSWIMYDYIHRVSSYYLTFAVGICSLMNSAVYEAGFTDTLLTRDSATNDYQFIVETIAGIKNLLDIDIPEVLYDTDIEIVFNRLYEIRYPAFDTLLHIDVETYERFSIKKMDFAKALRLIMDAIIVKIKNL